MLDFDKEKFKQDLQKRVPNAIISENVMTGKNKQIILQMLKDANSRYSHIPTLGHGALYANDNNRSTK